MANGNGPSVSRLDRGAVERDAGIRLRAEPCLHTRSGPFVSATIHPLLQAKRGLVPAGGLVPAWGIAQMHV
ncbi:MAG: hypothetical protein WD873_02260, partial [Candidatus Hydrogenedentales bacterium]